MIDTSATFKRSQQQVSCRINDEVAILNLDRALYFGLQGAGVHVWDALEQPKSFAELCASVVEEYDVSPEVCRADLVQILQSLQDEGLVERA
jgi:hypothetical protein